MKYMHKIRSGIIAHVLRFTCQASGDVSSMDWLVGEKNRASARPSPYDNWWRWQKIDNSLFTSDRNE